MNVKIYFYVFFTMLSAYTLTGVNFDAWMKKNKIWESRLLVIILSFTLGYLLTNFIFDFLKLSKIIG
ncbi:MAG: DUF1146 domain-containing protein [Bacilli bacterium]|jgi:uncharacterized integral membrane protein (TIGR02327 family)|nr:DUF1146 domain-containing protein [Bacilli bacterium]